jgi:hypothetical protein
LAQIGSMKHVDMRRLPAAAQEERRRQVIGLRQGCVFRRNQPPIPIEASHLFRSKPAGHSDDASRGGGVVRGRVH